MVLRPSLETQSHSIVDLPVRMTDLKGLQIFNSVWYIICCNFVQSCIIQFLPVVLVNNE